jgi:DNA-nicking Smr family endonuclease
MSRRLPAEDARLWSLVTATVRPFPGRKAPAPQGAPDRKAPAAGLTAAPSAAKPKPVVRPHQSAPDPIEPRRKRNLARGKNPLEATIDLHGYGEFAAQDALRAFVFRAYDQGLRAILVITGRGVQGSGILRRRAPDWLAAPDLRHIVAGFSESHQRHGGEGALYVAIKRRTS